MSLPYNNSKAIEFYIKEREKFGLNIRGKRVIGFANIKPGDSVLDLCCGPGFVAKVIKEKIGDKGKILGIDYSPIFIKHAKQICSTENTLFKCGNIENFDKISNDKKFDHIILLASWPWIKNKNKLISKIKKSLNQKGKFTLSLSGDNIYNPKTKEFFKKYRENLKLVITKKFPKADPSYIDKGLILNKKYLNKCISQINKKGFKVVCINRVKRKLSVNDKLFLYKNPARTNWVGKFEIKDRFEIIKKALKETSKEMNGLKFIERNTYYITFQPKHDFKEENNFYEKIYSQLKKVPSGKVTTYKALANSINSKAYQAVGNAMRHNPYFPIVPCHRCIKSNGFIGGFGGKIKGKKIQEKISLLKKEGIEIKNNKINLKKYLFRF